MAQPSAKTPAKSSKRPGRAASASTPAAAPAQRLAPAQSLTTPEKTPFLSLRNVPLWVGLFLGAVFAVLMVLRPGQ